MTVYMNQTQLSTRYDQLGLGGALDDGDGIPIREGALLGGKDVVDGDLLILVPVSVDAALVGAGAVLVGMFVHSCEPALLQSYDAASAAQHILPSVGPDSNRRSRQGLEGGIGQMARIKNWLPIR